MKCRSHHKRCFPKNNIGVFYLLAVISYEDTLNVSLHRMTRVSLKQFMISGEYLNFHSENIVKVISSCYAIKITFNIRKFKGSTLSIHVAG